MSRSAVRIALVALFASLLGGCDEKKPVAAVTPSSRAPAPARSVAIGPGVIALARGSAAAPAASGAVAKSPFPKEARRNSPPAGLEQSALALGKAAPSLKQLASTLGPWTRADKTTVLVFYRGHW